MKTVEPRPPRPRRVKFAGQRSDWTVTFEGETFGVIHNRWWTPPTLYHDPMVGAATDGKRYTKLKNALENNDRVVMQKASADGTDERGDYVGVFRFTDLSFDVDGGITLKITERLPLNPAR